jgi:hypothetical protein
MSKTLSVILSAKASLCTTLWLLSPVFVLSQNNFVRFLPTNDFETVYDMQIAAGDEMRLAASNHLYRIAGDGQVKLSLSLQEGLSSGLHAVIPQPDGGDIVLAHVFEDINTQRLIWIRVSAGGAVQERKIVEEGGNYSGVYMKALSSNRMIITYLKRDAENDNIVWAVCLDGSGATQWQKAITVKVYNQYRVDTAAGKLEVFYQVKDSSGARMTRVDQVGQISELDFQFTAPIAGTDYLREFVRAGDGSYFLAGSRSYIGTKREDLVLVRSNASGVQEEAKVIDIRDAEAPFRLARSGDGVLVLLASGMKEWGNSFDGELLLLKTDRSLHEVWRRAFASPTTDAGQFILEKNGSIYMTARMSLVGDNSNMAVAFRLKSDGTIDDDFPYSTEPRNTIREAVTGAAKGLQELRGSIAVGNNSIILGTNELDTTTDRWQARLSSSTVSGNLNWSVPLPIDKGELKFISRIRPNDNLAALELPAIFSKLYHIYEFDDNGQINWTYSFGASHLRSAIRCSDGGYLLLGDLDISFINFDIILVKLDAHGQEQWTKTIGAKGKWELPYAIVETPDQDFILAGTSRKEFDVVSYLLAMRINQEGQVIWQKEIGNGQEDITALSLASTGNDRYTLAGFREQAPFQDRDLFLCSINGAGTVLEQRTIPLHENEEAMDILPMASGGYLVAGNTSRFKAGIWQQRGFVMRVPLNGQLPETKYYGEYGEHLALQKFLIVANDTLVAGTLQKKWGEAKPVYLQLEAGEPGPHPTYYSDWKLYPNPSPDQSTLSWSSDFRGDIRIEVFDAKGQRCLQAAMPKTSQQFQYEIKLAGAASGIYFIRIHYEGNRQHLRWQKIN